MTDDISDLDVKNAIVELLKKTKIETFNEFRNSVNHISSKVDDLKKELDLYEGCYTKCHICHKFLRFYYGWEKSLEINPLYCCDYCGEIYCEECGNIHKKRHIDERRLEMYKAKKQYRSKRLRNKTARLQNKQFFQTQISNNINYYL